ncbi:hypothetical protein F4827_002396 [Paraburkholderia bannensis]|uniref:Uncharacterized protein n=1 Tax=Paraburkholderia bannensis TaxID=765414 RepID=A0A7W9TWD6_9BURK|nr:MULTISPECIES: hypothetical protein [Paraburkholderia]MBB3257531.1 hypothetical protein [Paraburkholderia sp. WP4_3_2]MBB6102544.1 hypothetical protein [Paraburkholderia bannensis]
MPANATDLPIVSANTSAWNQAVSAIKTGGKTNFRVASSDDAEAMLQQAKPGIELKPTYTGCPYKKGYEHHPNEAGTVNAPQNNLPHIKWKDWGAGKKAGGAGHIFYGDQND